MMDANGKLFLVRFRDGYALRFGERIAVVAPDGEASRFGSPAEAAAAVARCGVPQRGLIIEEVTKVVSAED